jgi:hypothetical protein
MSEEFRNAEQSLSRLVSRPAAGLKVINQLPEATMLRIEGQGGQRQVYSLLRNRATATWRSCWARRTATSLGWTR